MSALTAGLLALCAVGAATMSAILGVGGGVVLLSGLLLVVPGPAVVPLHGAVQSVAGLSRVLAFRSYVEWGMVWRFLAALVPGSLLGLGLVAWIVQVEPHVIEMLVAVAILVSLFWKKPKVDSSDAPRSLTSFYALGLLCGLLGVIIGTTGPIVTQALLRHGVAKEAHVATKSVVQMLGNALKIPLFGLGLGFDFTPWAGPLVAMMVAVAIGTLLGRRLLTRISKERFVAAARVLLAGAALQILVTALYTIMAA